MKKVNGTHYPKVKVSLLPSCTRAHQPLNVNAALTCQGSDPPSKITCSNKILSPTIPQGLCTPCTQGKGGSKKLKFKKAQLN